ncbi:MAG: hypothetical protein ACM37W_17450 [Actinomycetota bacterium]
MTNHSLEYQHYIKSKKWRSLSRKCCQSTGHRCCVYSGLKATQSHHVSYENLGHERIGVDIFPVSDDGHKLLHNQRFWQNPQLRELVRRFLVKRYEKLRRDRQQFQCS